MEMMNKKIERMVGRNICRIREECGLTQEQLAARLQTNDCEITRSALAKMEVGLRHIYPDELILIKKLLNTSYDEILTV